jgi:nucleoside-diphosphate-sugar epimerase
VRPILVTGAQGFLGRAFAAAALRAGERVVGFGRSQRNDSAFTHNIRVRDKLVLAPLPQELRAAFDSSRYEYYCGDVLDSDCVSAVIARTEPWAVVHLAAALRDAEFADLLQTNVAGTMALLDAIDRAAVAVTCIVMGSSGSVYGSSKELPTSEESRCEPADVYGITKVAAERIVAVRAKPGVRVVNARIFNVVGPGQDGRHVCGRFVEQAVALDDNRTVIHVGDLRPTRDFIDVRDVAEGLLKIVRQGSGSYNVCSGAETPIAAILEIALRCAGRNGNAIVEQTYRREAEISREVGNNGRLRSTNWAPRYSLERSIEDLVGYYRSVG